MTPIIVILLLIIISGVFVMAEMALVSARKTRLQQMADDGRSGARIALELRRGRDAADVGHARDEILKILALEDSAP